MTKEEIKNVLRFGPPQFQVLETIFVVDTAMTDTPQEVKTSAITRVDSDSEGWRYWSGDSFWPAAVKYHRLFKTRKAAEAYAQRTD